MSTNNKVRIFNHLFLRLYLNYAVMLLVTAILICLIFMKLYEETTMQNHKNQLKDQAENISKIITGYINVGKDKEFLEYHDILQKINNMDIWTISKPQANNPMKVETTSFDEIADLESYSRIIVNAFNNKPDYINEYNEIYDTQMIAVSYPVYGINREVVGAVLLMSPLEGQNDVVSNSLSLIIVSSIVALAISFIIIILFATELSLPISRMRATALELAAGNYHCKTEINRKDEIGDLAKTVDILSEKLLENEIQRKNLDQMRLDFFANVSHELRTPITVVRAYMETLVDGVVKDETKVKQYYERMLSECSSMERLVGDLLLLSKMQNPDFYIEREPVNLLQVFEDIIRSAYAIASKKNISIYVNEDSPTYMMLGDYDRLRQMFMIILDNAIKFSEENKSVHIKLRKQDKIIVSIRDEGVGIEESDIANIFEKFYKSNLRQNASGTGLGLAIAKQIALKHEGEIDVKSTPGVGTEFIFTFPILEMEF